MNLTITVIDVDDLYIEAAFYDDNGTVDATDDKLYMQYSSTLETNTIKTPVSENFVINSVDSIDGGDSTGVYDASVRYYPHIVTLDGANALAEQNISIAIGTLESNITGVLTEDTTKTLIRPVTGSKSVKKTGQTKSYYDMAKAYHQSGRDDGYYQAGVTPRYSRDDTAKAVTDHITGLMWQDDENVTSNEQNWTEAIAYCADLNTTASGGYDDWRLPTSVELEGVVDYGSKNPATDVAFQYTRSSLYWSSTTVEGGANGAWFVVFNDGSTSSLHKSNDTLVRCVRVGQ